MTPTPEQIKAAKEVDDKITRIREAVQGGYDVSFGPVQIIVQALASYTADKDRVIGELRKEILRLEKMSWPGGEKP